MCFIEIQNNTINASTIMAAQNVARHPLFSCKTPAEKYRVSLHKKAILKY